MAVLRRGRVRLRAQDRLEQTGEAGERPLVGARARPLLGVRGVFGAVGTVGAERRRGAAYTHGWLVHGRLGRAGGLGLGLLDAPRTRRRRTLVAGARAHDVRVTRPAGTSSAAAAQWPTPAPRAAPPAPRATPAAVATCITTHGRACMVACTRQQHLGFEPTPAAVVQIENRCAGTRSTTGDTKVKPKATHLGRRWCGRGPLRQVYDRAVLRNLRCLGSAVDLH